MEIAKPIWPYLIQKDGVLSLEEPCENPDESEVGDYGGEWGSALGSNNRPCGILLMFCPDEHRKRLLSLAASNVEEKDGDIVIQLEDHRLVDVEGMPFLPVYCAELEDGRAVYQLSGYK